MDLSIFQELINYVHKDINYYSNKNYLQYGQLPTTYIEWEI